MTLGIPVWWHIADPVAFFDPVDEHNEFLELLAARPDWSFAGPGVPQLRAAHGQPSRRSSPPTRARRSSPSTRAATPRTSAGWAACSTRYPNFHIDIAARIAQLGRQPRATRELVLRHPDRVLFGCDEIPHTGESYPTHFRFLETDDEHFAHSDEDPPLMGRWAI